MNIGLIGHDDKQELWKEDLKKIFYDLLKKEGIDKNDIHLNFIESSLVQQSSFIPVRSNIYSYINLRLSQEQLIAKKSDIVIYLLNEPFNVTMKAHFAKMMENCAIVVILEKNFLNNEDKDLESSDASDPEINTVNIGVMLLEADFSLIAKYLLYILQPFLT